MNVDTLSMTQCATVANSALARARSIRDSALTELLETLNCYAPCSWQFIRRQLIEQVPGIETTDDAPAILQEGLVRDIARLHEHDSEGVSWYVPGEAK